MNPEKPFKEGFQDPGTKGSVFGETESSAADAMNIEMRDEDDGEEEAEGISAGTAEIVREKLKEYFVPPQYHEEVVDLMDEMMMGKLGKELQEEAGFDDQLKAAIAKVEERHGVSFEIEYDDEE